jgi:nicotinate-nucleotide pyrophosphorylase (carboxylating)
MRPDLHDVVRHALEEDVGLRDLTTLATVPHGARARALITQKEPGVVFGLAAAEFTFRARDAGVHIERLAVEGSWREGGPVLSLEGEAAGLLTAERTALNLLARLSGVATLTRRYVDAAADTGVQILDTRKTTPGLRVLEKHAVRCGGGTNHRFGLYDAILIKDNHLKLAGGVADAVRKAQGHGVPVEVECETLDHVREALDAGADLLLLDNMSVSQLREAVLLVGGSAKTEASGGVKLGTVQAIARTGVDFISVGALTHSARSLDVSMEVK